MAEGPQRLQSLDILRGLAVAGMLLVNSPGSWEYIYPPLDHAKWNGWTPTDLVFPSFLFCVGAAIALSLGKPRAGEKLRIARRALTLILLGLFLQALPNFDLAHLRFPGVLQRIGVCYALGAYLFLLTARRDEGGVRTANVWPIGAVIAFLLVGYWALLTFVPAPGFGAGRLDSWGSLPAYIDRAVFSLDHMWIYGTTEGHGVTYDPEGLLSTLPALANVLFGMIAARIAQRGTPAATWAPVLGFGVVLIVAGLALHPVFPLNKRIWTSSFAIFSSGATMAAFGLLIVAAQAPLVVKAAYPLRVLGGNAILAYVIAWLMEVGAGLPLIASPGGPIGAQSWTFNQVHRFVADPYQSSLACALLVVAFITLLLIPLNRRGVYLRL
ncbi:MAG TPA: heparan-alpha-glucosaminide N-acetyltransferase domain-containing protein [Caulobacterales bacterium]|nr:heparan-alpha-glucosaminide N-acetyltransferase domain-containing protein [Caulobacterales bacterium]